MTGTAGGNLISGHRWARPKGTNQEEPAEYYDGKEWLALPDGFDPDGVDSVNHSSLSGAVGFGKIGNFYTSNRGVWPEPFPDYDFDSPEHKAKRDAWIARTNEIWSYRFRFRRKGCKSRAPTRCCLYTIRVRLEFNVVELPGNDVVVVCPEALRSNAHTFFMGDPLLEMAAHEAGHHMFNPDEYPTGAFDPTVNGDGAVGGIDPTTLMGSNTEVVKKRHYKAALEMLARLVFTKFGRLYLYEAVDP